MTANTVLTRHGGSGRFSQLSFLPDPPVFAHNLSPGGAQNTPRLFCQYLGLTCGAPKPRVSHWTQLPCGASQAKSDKCREAPACESILIGVILVTLGSLS